MGHEKTDMIQTNAQARLAVNLDGVEHDCGGHFRLVEEKRDVVIGQSHVPIIQQFFRCDACDEERQTLDQLGAARRAAALSVRERDRMLSGAEIRRIREERLQITQGALERALGLGEKTVVRWETERVLQPKATDNLLRLLDRDPSALSYLAAHHDVELPEHCVAAQSHSTDDHDAECSVPVPRSYMRELESAARGQGVSPEAYVVWLLAEKVTAARATNALETRVAAMHKDLAGRIDTTWKQLSYAWPPRVGESLTGRSKQAALSLSPTDRKPYAQSA
jgi:putative zinc finger/helix-turn-helix YgiT family protein